MTTVRVRFFEMFSELKSEGYTQVKIAEALGISQASVSGYIRGEHDISPPVAALMEIRFGYRKEWLLNGELPKKVDQISKKSVSEDVEFARKILKDPELKEILQEILALKKADRDRLFSVIRGFLGKG
ncbi:XRE family transcriptional regulator [Leptospira bourretii]|uniref:XRE family transcriptional regulator n=2 Tax=Leptospira bourretii TaxID=2484962 RepID=A0A4R9IQQ6_9LEPT|nr:MULTISPECIES: helix-turn-helix transcriptional regulator [Leptospira]TGK79245.1 XRE family transcriptional regulator [Leptospira bourretii]TGK94358.1 XRE family transcriptional regulator [Leptospira bourretii]TGL16847.1 XRE family transcriptional regulator [Leptospira levettii]TGL38821.1 XRE family transcriptional regulator [Leptospira bourretii]